MDAGELTKQLEAMRRYTSLVLGDIREEDWFRHPEGCHTHVAWQVGHCAVAEYGLALKSVRGERPEDEDLMTKEFRGFFNRGSVPKPAGESPSVAEIKNALEAVHEQVLKELPDYSSDLLAQKVDFEHPLFETKQEAITWCAHHELTHAGQIALIRRLLGYEIRF